MRDTASLGSPTVCSTITMVTSPAWGIPAAPMLAAVAVMEMAKMSPILAVTPYIWAMKSAATASYRAVPSCNRRRSVTSEDDDTDYRHLTMLIVAPMGSTNLEILGSTLFFSSRQFMVTGSVAELEAVPQAVVSAANMFLINLRKKSMNTFLLQDSELT